MLETVSDNASILTSTNEDEDEDYDVQSSAAPGPASGGREFDFDVEIINTAAYRGAFRGAENLDNDVSGEISEPSVELLDNQGELMMSE